ncbi:MAG: dual specificity protein phosphatase family protein [Candidatus Lokiarchaeota archaeon]|nr:dual specificity protein phosphatase family protein [Candidatus Lokiarchaeota archaeon]
MIRPWYWPEGGQPHRTEPFTWIVKDNMAASWWPDPPVFKRYEKEGIRVVINCSEFDNRKDVPNRFTYYHINIPDYGIPTDNQIEKFLEITKKHAEKKESIVVHCVAGCGRTGQMIVAWGAFNGLIPKGLDPVQWIRNYRKCSLETKEQMSLARKIASKYQK